MGVLHSKKRSALIHVQKHDTGNQARRKRLSFSGTCFYRLVFDGFAGKRAAESAAEESFRIFSEVNE